MDYEKTVDPFTPFQEIEPTAKERYVLSPVERAEAARGRKS
jgi:hypothetical protein